MPDRTATCDHLRPVSLKRLLIATSSLPAAALAMMMAFMPEAAATPIKYTLEGAVINSIGSLQVSGGFTYDPTTGSESNVSIILSGTYASFATTGTYTQTPATIPSVAIPFSIPTIEAGVGGLSAGAEVIGFSFTSTLLDSPDDVSLIQWCGASTSTCNGGEFAIFGESTPPVIADPVPEPSSIVLLGSALGLFLRRRRASRRGGSPAADQPRTTQHLART